MASRLLGSMIASQMFPGDEAPGANQRDDKNAKGFNKPVQKQVCKTDDESQKKDNINDRKKKVSGNRSS